MIGNPALGIIVGTNALGSVAGTHLGAAVRRPFGVELLAHVLEILHVPTLVAREGNALGVFLEGGRLLLSTACTSEGKCSRIAACPATSAKEVMAPIRTAASET